jgi:hypothetical protein
VQKDHQEFGAIEWVNVITDLIADIIRNRRRSVFRSQRRDNPDEPPRKQGRPRASRADQESRNAAIRGASSAALVAVNKVSGKKSSNVSAAKGRHGRK